MFILQEYASLFRQTSIDRRAPLAKCITDQSFNDRANTDSFTRVKVNQKLKEPAIQAALMVLAVAGLHPAEYDPNFDKPNLTEMRKILREIVLKYRARGPSVAMRDERGLTGLYVAIKRGGFDEREDVFANSADPFLSISADDMLKNLEHDLNICPEVNVLKKKTESRLRGLQVIF